MPGPANARGAGKGKEATPKTTHLIEIMSGTFAVTEIRSWPERLPLMTGQSSFRSSRAISPMNSSATSTPKAGSFT
ncbi:MAG: hypothetical protein RMN24_02765, partial [Anaerolineae bacterium]|nr:hypothetical protein [Anaerolineae bacterium]